MKKEKKPQRIIIPKGTIDPNEDTLIEVPTGMQGKPVVVTQREKRISIKESTKSVELESYSEQEGNRTINTTGADRRSSPRPEMESYFVGQNFNGSDIDDDDFDRLSDKRQSSRQGLEDTDRSMAARSGSRSSNVCCRNIDCASGTEESPRKPKRRTLSSCVLCDIAIQCQPPKSLQFVSSPNRSSTSLEFLPVSASSPKHSVDYSRDTKEAGTKTSPLFTEGEGKRISLKVDKGITAICTNPVCIESGQKPKTEDSSTTPAIKEEAKELSGGECKECCQKSDKTPKVSRTVKKHQQMRSPEELRQMYKCPDCDEDDVYIQQLKTQFAEAKRKLEEAIVLASMSLRQLKAGQKFSTILPRSRTDSIVDSVPERDISFIPSYQNKPFTPCVRDSCENLNENLSSPRDRYKNTEIYNNITTRTTSHLEPPRSPIHQDIDNPCPFLKTACPSPSHCYRLYKERHIQAEERSTPDQTKYKIDEKPKKDPIGSIQICPGCTSGCCTTTLRDSCKTALRDSSGTAVRDSSRIVTRDNSETAVKDSGKSSAKDAGKTKEKGTGAASFKFKKQPRSDTTDIDHSSKEPSNAV